MAFELKLGCLVSNLKYSIQQMKGSYPLLWIMLIQLYFFIT